MTRKITNSEYDHVAMVLRFQPEPDEVFILDSTSAGVQVSRWSQFRLLLDKNYYHLFYRPLTFPRESEYSEKLEEFLQAVIGNKYSLSVTDLFFKRETDRNLEEDLSSRQFFCSELIAKAYKRCGILKSDVASCQFLPGDFSSKSDKLSLTEGAKLEEEILLMLDHDDIRTKKGALD